MKEFIKKNLLKIIGIILGSISGFAYYFYIGCTSGTCPITSNPYISIIYGGVVGYLITDLFKKKKKEHGTN